MFFTQCFDTKNLAIFSHKKGEQKESDLHLEKINLNLFVRKKKDCLHDWQGILSFSQLPYIKKSKASSYMCCPNIFNVWHFKAHFKVVHNQSIQLITKRMVKNCITQIAWLVIGSSWPFSSVLFPFGGGHFSPLWDGMQIMQLLFCPSPKVWPYVATPFFHFVPPPNLGMIQFHFIGS